MNFQYLQGLDYVRLSTDGVFLLKNQKTTAPNRLLCPYKYRSSTIQTRLSQIVKNVLEDKFPYKYVLCPIIDVNVLAQIDIRENFEENYESDYPYLFITRKERNTLFINLETQKKASAIFSKLQAENANVSTVIAESHGETLKLKETEQGVTQLYRLIANYKNFYFRAYSNDWMLQTLSNNIFYQLQIQIMFFVKNKKAQQQT